MMYYRNLGLLMLMLLVLALPVKAQKSSDVILQKSFENGELFFIFPRVYEASPGEIEFETDYTVNFQKDSLKPDHVQMNFTVYASKPVKNILSLEIHSGGRKIATIKNFEKFYLEKKEGKWAARFGAGLSFAELIAILDSDQNTKLQVVTEEGKFELQPDKKSRKDYALAYETLTYRFD